MKSRIIIFFLLMIVPIKVHAIEIYNTIYVEGKAPISIDGDLSDWSFINVTPFKIEWIDPLRNAPESDSDLSASFTCFHDAYNIYFAVVVRDESFDAEQKVFGWSWFDDTVEIIIDGDVNLTPEEGFDKNDIKIRLLMDNKGNTLLEGFFLQNNIKLPYMWEELGVRAAHKQNEEGYDVEVSIPYNLLEWEKWETGRRIGIHLRVFDDDDGGICDSIIGWQNDPDELFHYTTKNFNQVAFTKPITITSSGQTNQVEVLNNNVQEITAVIEDSYKKLNYNDMITIMDNLQNRDFYNTAQSILSANNEQPLVLALMGLFQSKNGMYEECIQTFSKLVEKSQDNSISLWASIEIGRAYINLGENSKAEDELNKLLSLSENWVAEFDFIQELGRAGAYRVAAKLLENLINSNEKNERRPLSDARLELARYYFYLGDYDKATKLAKELINQNVDSKTTLDAQMILLSIDQKKLK